MLCYVQCDSHVTGGSSVTPVHKLVLAKMSTSLTAPLLSFSHGPCLTRSAPLRGYISRRFDDFTMDFSVKDADTACVSRHHAITYLHPSQEAIIRARLLQHIESPPLLFLNLVSKDCFVIKIRPLILIREAY